MEALGAALYIYLLHALSLRVQTTEITIQKRSQDVTDLGTDGRPALAHLDSLCQEAKTIVTLLEC